MAERIITLRPHHIDRFVSYFHQFVNPLSDPAYLQGYGEEFAGKLKDFFDELASGGTGEEYILILNRLDDICDMCPVKEDTCSDPDSLSLWNGAGKVLQEMDLRTGSLYPLEEFVGKVKQLYPDRNPSQADWA